MNTQIKKTWLAIPMGQDCVFLQAMWPRAQEPRCEMCPGCRWRRQGSEKARRGSCRVGAACCAGKWRHLGWISENTQTCISYCTAISWLVVFNLPSTARSLRDGIPIYCPLRRTWSLINTPFPSGIEPKAVAWQSITLPLRYASSMTAIRLQ